MAGLDSKQKIYLIEDQLGCRKAISQMLRNGGFEPVCFASGKEFLARGCPRGPTCLLLDIKLRGTVDGREVLKRIVEARWPVPVILISAYVTVPIAVEAVRRGAINVLTKPVSSKELLPAVSEALVTAHEMVRDHRETVESQRVVGTLTPREIEILQWIITGSLNKQIAGELGITERTVKAHRTNLMQKLKIFSVAELVRFAEKCGIVPPADWKPMGGG